MRIITDTRAWKERAFINQGSCWKAYQKTMHRHANGSSSFRKAAKLYRLGIGLGIFYRYPQHSENGRPNMGVSEYRGP